MSDAGIKRLRLSGKRIIYAPAGDSFFPAVLPIKPAITNASGTLAAVETGSDTFASTGDVFVKGSLVATESGSDTFSASGTTAQVKKPGSGGVGRNWALFDDKPAINGKASATESGKDGFRAVGRIKSGALRGSMRASESGSDGCQARGRTLVHLPTGLIVSQARHIRRHRATLIRSS